MVHHGWLSSGPTQLLIGLCGHHKVSIGLTPMKAAVLLEVANIWSAQHGQLVNSARVSQATTQLRELNECLKLKQGQHLGNIPMIEHNSLG